MSEKSIWVLPEPVFFASFDPENLLNQETVAYFSNGSFFGIGNGIFFEKMLKDWSFGNMIRIFIF